MRAPDSGANAVSNGTDNAATQGNRARKIFAFPKAGEQVPVVAVTDIKDLRVAKTAKPAAGAGRTRASASPHARANIMPHTGSHRPTLDTPAARRLMGMGWKEHVSQLEASPHNPFKVVETPHNPFKVEPISKANQNGATPKDGHLYARLMPVHKFPIRRKAVDFSKLRHHHHHHPSHRHGMEGTTGGKPVRKRHTPHAWSEWAKRNYNSSLDMGGLTAQLQREADGATDTTITTTTTTTTTTTSNAKMVSLPLSARGNPQTLSGGGGQASMTPLSKLSPSPRFVWDDDETPQDDDIPVTAVVGSSSTAVTHIRKNAERGPPLVGAQPTAAFNMKGTVIAHDVLVENNAGYMEELPDLGTPFEMLEDDTDLMEYGFGATTTTTTTVMGAALSQESFQGETVVDVVPFSQDDDFPFLDAAIPSLQGAVAPPEILSPQSESGRSTPPPPPAADTARSWSPTSDDAPWVNHVVEDTPLLVSSSGEAVEDQQPPHAKTKTDLRPTGRRYTPTWPALKRPTNTLHLLNVPHWYSATDVEREMSPFGGVSKVCKEVGSKFFGIGMWHVELEDVDVAERVVADNLVWDGREVKVEFVDECRFQGAHCLTEQGEVENVGEAKSGGVNLLGEGSVVSDDVLQAEGILGELVDSEEEHEVKSDREDESDSDVEEGPEKDDEDDDDIESAYGTGNENGEDEKVMKEERKLNGVATARRPQVLCPSLSVGVKHHHQTIQLDNLAALHLYGNAMVWDEFMSAEEEATLKFSVYVPTAKVMDARVVEEIRKVREMPGIGGRQTVCDCVMGRKLCGIVGHGFVVVRLPLKQQDSVDDVRSQGVVDAKGAWIAQRWVRGRCFVCVMGGREMDKLVCGEQAVEERGMVVVVGVVEEGS
ncbi:hypothetical protein HDU85_002692 [Gaertneriomyces sp. JEL0708]|nr:hypothetical protein HDU85_002692 [Gaertneriomyces sp. JEL0708]